MPLPDLGPNLYFGSRSPELSEAVKTQLLAIPQELRSDANVHAEINGFADPQEAPTQSKRRALGRKRAVAVMDYLVELGVSVSRLVAIGNRHLPLIPRNNDEETVALMRFVYVMPVRGGDWAH